MAFHNLPGSKRLLYALTWSNLGFHTNSPRPTKVFFSRSRCSCSCTSAFDRRPTNPVACQSDAFSFPPFTESSALNQCKENHLQSVAGRTSSENNLTLWPVIYRLPTDYLQIKPFKRKQINAQLDFDSPAIRNFKR